MMCKDWLQHLIRIGLIFFLFGCNGAAAATPTPVSPTVTLTPQPTSTITPTITPSPSPTSTPTSTPVPIPPMPTYQLLKAYSNPVVEFTDLQGVKTTVEVDGIDTGEGVGVGISFPLTIADGVHAEIVWANFRRAYLSEGEHIVTLFNEQEVQGQLEFSIVDPEGNKYDLRSMSTMVLAGIGKYSLPSSLINISGQKWQIHIPGPADLTFTITNPRLGFEYTTITTMDQQVVSTGSSFATTEIFSIGLDDTVTRKLPSQDEVRKNKNGQMTVKANDVETTGELIPIPDYNLGTGKYQKGTTPYWNLQGAWVETGLLIRFDTPEWTLTKAD